MTVSELCESTVRASYIVFLFVNENNFIKEIKHVVRASLISSRILPNVRLGEGTESMFYFLSDDMLLHLWLEVRCLDMCEALSVVKCSRRRVKKCRLVLPM